MIPKQLYPLQHRPPSFQPQKSPAKQALQPTTKSLKQDQTSFSKISFGGLTSSFERSIEQLNKKISQFEAYGLDHSYASAVSKAFLFCKLQEDLAKEMEKIQTGETITVRPQQGVQKGYMASPSDHCLVIKAEKSVFANTSPIITAQTSDYQAKAIEKYGQTVKFLKDDFYIPLNTQDLLSNNSYHSTICMDRLQWKIETAKERLNSELLDSILTNKLSMAEIKPNDIRDLVINLAEKIHPQLNDSSDLNRAAALLSKHNIGVVNSQDVAVSMGEKEFSLTSLKELHSALNIYLSEAKDVSAALDNDPLKKTLKDIAAGNTLFIDLSKEEREALSSFSHQYSIHLRNKESKYKAELKARESTPQLDYNISAFTEKRTNTAIEASFAREMADVLKEASSLLDVPKPAAERLKGVRNLFNKVGNLVDPYRQHKPEKNYRDKTGLVGDVRDPINATYEYKKLKRIESAENPAAELVELAKEYDQFADVLSYSKKMAALYSQKETFFTNELALRSKYQSLETETPRINQVRDEIAENKKFFEDMAGVLTDFNSGKSH